MRPYEAVLLRYRHDMDAGEFANVGVVLLDVDERRVVTRISSRYKRLSDFFANFNGGSYRAMLRHVEHGLRELDSHLKQPSVFDGGRLSLEQLLRGVLPDPDACILTSTAMSGVTSLPDIRLEELYQEFVARYEDRDEVGRRDEEDIGRELHRQSVRLPFREAIKWQVPIQAANYFYEFKAGWQNGKPQVLEPISFDMSSGTRIVDKANLWTGRLANLSRGADFAFSAVVAPPRDGSLRGHFERAMTLLRGAPTVREIVTEDATEELFEIIRADVEAHGSSQVARP